MRSPHPLTHRTVPPPLPACVCIQCHWVWRSIELTWSGLYFPLITWWLVFGRGGTAESYLTMRTSLQLKFVCWIMSDWKKKKKSKSDCTDRIPMCPSPCGQWKKMHGCFLSPGFFFTSKASLISPPAFVTELSSLNYHRERYALHRWEGKNCILNGLYLQQWFDLNTCEWDFIWIHFCGWRKIIWLSRRCSTVTLHLSKS